MSAGNYGQDARDIIEEFISPRGTLTDMQNIHRQVTGEREDFNRWDNVKDLYGTIDWDEEKFDEFLKAAKTRIEESMDELPETYFNILQPREVSTDFICNVLERQQWVEDEDTDGFTFRRREDGIVVGEYIYTTIDIDITQDYQVRSFPNRKNIPFRIEPDTELIILDTTYSPYVGKFKKVMNDFNGVQIDICGDVTQLKDRANELYEDFVSDLDNLDGGESVIERINEVKMYNPDTESDDPIKKIDYMGGDTGDVFGDDEIEDKKSEGWIIRGLSAKLNHQGLKYEVTVAGNKRMGYVKLENIGDYDAGTDLIIQLRELYMDHFGDI